MNNTNIQKTLEQEQRRLEEQLPEMAQNYRAFLDSFGRFNRMKAQFEASSAPREVKPQTQFRSTR